MLHITFSTRMQSFVSNWRMQQIHFLISQLVSLFYDANVIPERKLNDPTNVGCSSRRSPN